MTPEQFWARVQKTETCWLWSAAKTSAGYGQARINGSRVQYAHRLSYEWLVGPIPAGLVIDHLCRTPACVNPAHLEPVTTRVNTVRGVGPQRRIAQQRAKTHCRDGHPFTPENTYVKPNGNRNCRTCRAAATARFQARRAA